MNLVFTLSQPVDLSPVIADPIPPELFPGPEGFWFDKVYREFEPYFPDAFHFVIDGCAKPVYYRMPDNPDADVLNIPSSELFPRLFLFSAFSRAFLADPFSLFVPGNIVFDGLDSLALAVRRMQKHALGTAGITLFPSAAENPRGRWVEAGHEIDHWENGKLDFIERFTSYHEVLAARERDPGRRFYPVPEIFALNTFDFSETLCAMNDRWKDLFFLLVSAWKDGKTITTVMPEVIQELSGHTIEEVLSRSQERFVCAVDGGLGVLAGITGLLKMLPGDESGNYIEGEVILSEVERSLVIAKEGTLHLSGMSGCCGLSNDGETRIFIIGEGK